MDIKSSSNHSRLLYSRQSHRPKSKYAKIKSAIDTGKSMSKVEVLTNRACSKLKGELFLRIKPDSLSVLLKESTSESNVYNYSSQDVLEGKAVNVAPSVISMVNPSGLRIYKDSEFILLDLRDCEDYLSCRIKGSISFPSVNLSRDKINPQVLKMKNQEAKHIIIYGQDDKSSIDFAQQFGQRNYYNVYLLTGGFIDFAKSFPEFIEGNFCHLNLRVPSTPSSRKR